MAQRPERSHAVYRHDGDALRGIDMTTKKKAKQRPDRHSAESYESLRGDLSAWATEPAQARVAPAGTVVFSVRLGAEELEAVRGAAARNGTTVSDFIRSAVTTVLHGTRWTLADGRQTHAPIRHMARPHIRNHSSGGWTVGSNTATG